LKSPAAHVPDDSSCIASLAAAAAEASRQLKVPMPFLTTIVVPIVGNAAEHASALIFAVKNRMEISLGVAIGEHLVPHSVPYMQMVHALMRCCLFGLAWYAVRTVLGVLHT
jgi:calcium/proton exchanger cax